MSHPSKIKTGLTFGILAAVISVLVIVVRYKHFGSTPMELGVVSAVGFGLLIAVFFLAVQTRKRQLGGYADAKELFGTLFIIILIAELSFAVFNYIYLQYIDPGYLERFGQSSLAWMEKSKMPEKEITQLRQALKEQEQTSFGALALGFARAVIVDSIVGFIIAFVMKRNRPASA